MARAPQLTFLLCRELGVVSSNLNRQGVGHLQGEPVALRTSFNSALGSNVRVKPILAFLLLTPRHAPLPPPEGTDGLGLQVKSLFNCEEGLQVRVLTPTLLHRLLQLSGFYRASICGLAPEDFTTNERVLVKLFHDEFYTPYRLSPGLTRLLTQQPVAEPATWGMFADQQEFLRVSDTVRTRLWVFKDPFEIPLPGACRVPTSWSQPTYYYRKSLFRLPRGSQCFSLSLGWVMAGARPNDGGAGRRAGAHVPGVAGEILPAARARGSHRSTHGAAHPRPCHGGRAAAAASGGGEQPYKSNAALIEPQKRTGLISLCTNPVSILSVPIQTVH
jgi:hypothetical protein